MFKAAKEERYDGNENYTFNGTYCSSGGCPVCDSRIYLVIFPQEKPGGRYV